VSLALIEATDQLYAWLLGEAPAPEPLMLAPGGIDEPWVLRWSRRNLARFGPGSAWLMAAGQEIVGLCGHKTAPSAAGEVEIGYGVAKERRRLGYATRAVALIVAAARSDPRIGALMAETALANAPSQRVLAANGFLQTGRGHDRDEGEMIVWRLATPPR
jgi:RimJ/RimL family protein N-acetyltransferase